MRLHNPRLLEEALLYRLYEYAIGTGDRLDSESILRLFPKTRVTKTLLSFAINGLAERKYITVFNGLRTPYEISRDGFDYVRQRLAMNGSAIREFAENEEWLSRPELPDDDAADDAVPAADRTVTLDHNSAAYREAIEELDNVIEAATNSNELGAIDSAEKERVIAELEAGKRILKSEQVSVLNIRGLLGKTLSWLGEKFAAGIVGQLAQTAWALIKTLVGL